MLISNLMPAKGFKQVGMGETKGMLTKTPVWNIPHVNSALWSGLKRASLNVSKLLQVNIVCNSAVLLVLHSVPNFVGNVAVSLETTWHTFPSFPVLIWYFKMSRVGRSRFSTKQNKTPPRWAASQPLHWSGPGLRWISDHESDHRFWLIFVVKLLTDIIPCSVALSCDDTLLHTPHSLLLCPTSRLLCHALPSRWLAVCGDVLVSVQSFRIFFFCFSFFKSTTCKYKCYFGL